MTAPTDTRSAARAEGGETPEITSGDRKGEASRLRVWMRRLSLLACLMFAIGGIVLANYFIVEERDRMSAMKAREDKAAAVIQARYNDPTIEWVLLGPVVVLTDQEDQLIATWVQASKLDPNQQWECTTPLLVSEDEQSFGFEPIPALSPDRARDAVAKCTTHPGLAFGLPLDQESSP